MKITPKLRKEIERACRTDQKRIDIARQYGISSSRMSTIAHRVGIVRHGVTRGISHNRIASGLQRAVRMQNIVFLRGMAPGGV